MNLLIKILAILIVLTAALIAQLQFFGAPSSLIKAVQSYRSEGYVKSILPEPYLALFRNKDGICGEVKINGTTSDFRRYIAVSESYVLFDNDNEIFEDTWQITCVLDDTQRAELRLKLTMNK